MIPKREIEEKARGYSVSITTIERDYAQNWILAHMKKLNMALKGGTGIKKVFIRDYRFSDDLDFTMIDNYEKEDLEGLLIEALLDAKEESGIQFQDTITLVQSDNGYYAKIILIGVQTGAPIGIKLDLTLAENETILLPTQDKMIFHDYSDTIRGSIKSYALEEIVAEKIRTLFQRARARDVYDIWSLSSVVDKERVASILLKKFEIKDKSIDVQEFIQNKDTLASAWKVQLQHQMRDIPDFDEVFNYVLQEIKNYDTTVYASGSTAKKSD